MTQTIQPHSCACLNETEKKLIKNKSEEEDNISLLLQIFDNLNNLYEKLNKLNHTIQRKKLENLLQK